MCIIFNLKLCLKFFSLAFCNRNVGYFSSFIKHKMMHFGLGARDNMHEKLIFFHTHAVADYHCFLDLNVSIPLILHNEHIISSVT